MTASLTSSSSSSLLSSLEQAEEELAELLTRAKELKAWIKTHKEQREQHQHVDLVVLNGQKLELVLSWLHPKDLFRCLRVCKQWKHEIDQLLPWKQAATTLWSTLIAEIETSHCSSQLPMIRYRAITKSLVIQERPHQEDFYEISDTRCFSPQPTLQLQDLFILVRTRDRESGQIIGSWHKGFCSMDLQSRVDEYVLQVFQQQQNDDQHCIVLPKTSSSSPTTNHNHDPTVFVPLEIFDSLSFTIHLLRCDTGQSLCLAHESFYESINDDEQSIGVGIRKDGSDLQKNRSGLVAMGLWSVRDYSAICMDMEFKVLPVVQEQDDELVVRYHVNGIDFSFHGAICGHEMETMTKFQSVHEFLAFIDGMKWK